MIVVPGLVLWTGPSFAALTGGLISVATDNFTFEDELDNRFLPMGAFYFNDRHREPDPLDWWGAVREPEVAADFATAAALHCNTLRMRWTLTAVDPLAATPVIGTASDWQKCDLLVDLARDAGLRLYVGIEVPGFVRQDNLHLPVYAEAFRQVGRRYQDEPAIFCWELDAEGITLVGYNGDRARWEEWLLEEYATLQDVADAWGRSTTDPNWLDTVWQQWTSALHHSGAYDPVRGQTPELWYLDQLNDPGSVELGDWQRFRQDLYARKITRLAEAVRAVDPNHLVTVDLILWAFPLYRNPTAAGWGGPYGFAANGLEDLAAQVDFFGAHSYPMYLPPYTTEWYENLTRDPVIFERQLRYTETYLRYIRAAGNKPVVRSETGWHGGAGDYYNNSEADQRDWCEALLDRTKDCAVGWINWAFMDAPVHPDITRTSGLVTAGIRAVTDTQDLNPYSDMIFAGVLSATEAHRTKLWGERFSQLVPLLHADPTVGFVAGETLLLDGLDVLTFRESDLNALLQKALADPVYPADIRIEDATGSHFRGWGVY